MVTHLIQYNIHPLQVVQLSGHKNLKNLDSCSVASEQQQKAMSKITSRKPLADVMNTAVYTSPGINIHVHVSGNNIINVSFKNM